jgi:ssRNA-specific RNase YbeY (16S rRNA maturation enzyme)
MSDILLFIVIIIIILFLLPDSKILKLGKRKVFYLVNESNIDKNFVSSVVNIIKSSNWNKTFNLINTKDKNEADIYINLSERSELDKWNDKIGNVDSEIDSPKYYKDGKLIRYSVTTQSPDIKPEVFIDAGNWLNGVKESGLSLDKYKRYVINHELGHALGYDHNTCNEKNLVNGVCPVMHQSTVGCGPFKCGYEVSIYDYDKLIPGRYIR